MNEYPPLGPDDLRAIDLSDELVLLKGHIARREPADGFWERLDTDPELEQRAYTSWVVAEHEFDESWDEWERHPQGDKVVRVLEGEVVMTFQRDQQIRTTIVGAGESVVVPLGTWHTMDVRRPARILAITWGRGTTTRAR